MSEQTTPSPIEQASGDPEPDWAEFYKNFQKPGYISGFEVGNRLGGGVFGVVYKAKRESIGKPYAIKFLKIEDPSVRNQVLAELDTVQLFAQVDHPNLVSIEDKGVIDGVPYIVMGYAGDETLRSRLEEGRMSTDEALAVFVQAARGVQALHEHSLVHFDLKPANIFLKGEITRVGDYGLSKLITQTAMSLSSGRGTPYYMAPEMLRRKGDHRADIYSLGIILYECLTGNVPFQGDSEWEVLKAHEELPVEFPESMDPKYKDILGKMLAKEPENRPQSLAEILRELQAPVHLGDSVHIPTAHAPGHDGPNRPRRPWRLTQPKKGSHGQQVVANLKPAVTRVGRDIGEKVGDAVVAMSETVARTLGQGEFWAEVRRVTVRWWPWFVVMIGVTVMIAEGMRYDELAAAVSLVFWGCSLFALQTMYRVVDRKKPPRRKNLLRTLAAWLPAVLLMIGIAVIILDSVNYRDQGLAAAITFIMFGTLILGVRAFRWFGRGPDKPKS